VGDRVVLLKAADWLSGASRRFVKEDKAGPFGKLRAGSSLNLCYVQDDEFIKNSPH
jgi:hypothetical protein